MKTSWKYCQNKDKYFAIHSITNKLYELYWQDSYNEAQKEAIARFGRGTKIIYLPCGDLNKNDFIPAD